MDSINYKYAMTPLTSIGAGGLPRANPFFWDDAETNIRRPGCIRCCSGYLCKWPVGPNIPDHWYDGGFGWVTRFFTDVQGFSPEQKVNGIHACQVPLQNGQQCGFQVAPQPLCGCCPCFCPTSPVNDMAFHLITTHNINAPPRRQWASGLCDTQGCFDAWCCTPCQGSRQMEALYGYANSFNIWWCLFFCLAGLQSKKNEEGKNETYWIPPHVLVACLTRWSMVRLHNIDEGCCMTGLITLFCAPCSIAQTYREMSSAGAWPGGTLCSNLPPLLAGNPGMQ